MRFPEQLYRPGDVVQQLATLTLDGGSSGVVAASQTITFTNNDENYAWAVTNIFLSGLPGGGENITRLHFRLVTPATDTSANTFLLKDNPTPGAANTRVVLDWQGEIVVLPRWRIQGQVDKSAGVAAVTINLDVLGYRFPVGTFVRS